MTVCDACPMRLFNTKHYNLQGVGNPHFGLCIVVPNVDYNAYKKGDMGFSTQVSIIKSIISSTGELDDVYVVPLIRCNETIACELDDATYNRCITHFAKDMITYQFRHVMLLGDAGRKFLNCDITENLNNLCVSQKGKTYIVNYSPLIKYVDNSKFEVFKSHLLKWYNAVRNNYFEQYNILRI